MGMEGGDLRIDAPAPYLTIHLGWLAQASV